MDRWVRVTALVHAAAINSEKRTLESSFGGATDFKSVGFQTMKNRNIIRQLELFPVSYQANSITCRPLHSNGTVLPFPPPPSPLPFQKLQTGRLK